MTELPLSERAETDVCQVNEWARKLSETKLVSQLERGILRKSLEECGANFNLSPELLATLGKENYTNASKSEAMRKIWG